MREDEAECGGADREGVQCGNCWIGVRRTMFLKLAVLGMVSCIAGADWLGCTYCDTYLDTYRRRDSKLNVLLLWRVGEVEAPSGLRLWASIGGRSDTKFDAAEGIWLIQVVIRGSRDIPWDWWMHCVMQERCIGQEELVLTWRMLGCCWENMYRINWNIRSYSFRYIERLQIQREHSESKVRPWDSQSLISIEWFRSKLL